MLKLWIACLLTASATASAVIAQEAPAPPPEVARTVNALDGSWATDMKLTLPGQAPIAFKGTWNCHKIAAGGAVECSLSTQVPGLGPMEETDLWGYDPETKAVRIMTWNNMGEVHDHHGAWQGDKMVLHHTATAGGKPVEEDFEFSFPAANKMAFHFKAKAAEGVTTLEGLGTRQ